MKAPRTSCRSKFRSQTTPRNRVSLQPLLLNRKSPGPGRRPENRRRVQKCPTVQKTTSKNKTHPPQLNCPPAPQRRGLPLAHHQLAGSSHDQLRHLEGLNPSLCPRRSIQGVLGVCEKLLMLLMCDHERLSRKSYMVPSRSERFSCSLIFALCRSKSPARKKDSASPERKKRKSKSPARRRRSRSNARRKRSRSKSRGRSHRSRSRSRSPARKRRSRSPNARSRRRSKSTDRSKRSKSRSTGRRKRSRSGDRSRRSRSRSSDRRRRSRSRGRGRRPVFRSRSFDRRDRWKREPSHSPVLILRKQRRSGSRTRRSTSKTPPRLTELGKKNKLYIYVCVLDIN